MTWDDVKKVYHYPCPCGDRFEISKAQLANYEDIATCPSCSLIIRVIYDPVGLFIFTLPYSSLTARPNSLITKIIPRTTKAVPLHGSILLEVGSVVKVAAWGKWTLNLVKFYKTFHASDFWDPAVPCTWILHAFGFDAVDTTSYQRRTRLGLAQRTPPGTTRKWLVQSLHVRSSCGFLSSGSAAPRLTATTVLWLPL